MEETTHFCSRPFWPVDGLYSCLFLLLVLFVGENKLALAPLYLGSLYTRMDEGLPFIVKSLGWHNFVTYVDAYFLQMYLVYVRGLEPNEFDAIKTQNVIISKVEKEKTTHPKSRALRWSAVKPEGEETSEKK